MMGDSLYLPSNREQRWDECIKYIERTCTLEEAKALAKREGKRFNTSVWITAFGKMLQRRDDQTRPTNGEPHA